jgi:hypothetical protein
MKAKIVTSAADAIEALGGREFVGEWWGIGRTGIYDIIRRDRIPAGRRLQTYFALKSKGIEIAPKVVGLRAWSDLLPPAGRSATRKRTLRAA